MNSLTRPSRLLTSRTTTTMRSSTTSSTTLRRISLPSSSTLAGSASTNFDYSSTCMDVPPPPRFLQTATTGTSSSLLPMSVPKKMSAPNYYRRSFHATPRALEDAAAATEAATDSDDAAEPTPHPNTEIIEYAFTPPPPLSEESIQKVNGLFEQILHLDMIEVHLLTMVVNEQLGIQWNQVQGAGAGPIGGAGAKAAEEPVAEEKLLKDLKLVGFDSKAKIKVIKEVRSIAGLGLKEAKELVEGAPKIIQKELKPDKAEELKAQLEAVGAQIEIC